MAFLVSPLFRYVVLPLLVIGVLTGAYFGWKAEVQQAALIRAQRDALIELAKRKERTTAEKAALDFQMRRLPDERVRWCAILPKPTGCCTESGPCPEVDNAK